MSTMQNVNIEELRNGFAGELILPGDARYDGARAIWNAMIDRRPAVIARCAATSDVVRAIIFARSRGLAVSVRGGGHHIAGSALCDGGLVIDMSGMKAVHVDASARRAVVEAGATLADVDDATQAHGLAIPLGINSTTGVAGLTLGGGFGWLSRKHGMTVDNLEAAEVVTAGGEVLRASRDEHPDLFWALRGGGGNFGVVTRFEFRLHPVGPEVLCGLVVFPMAEAKSVLQQYRDFAERAPEELTVWAVLRQAPPLPFLPASVHGTDIVVLALCYIGSPEVGSPLVEQLRAFGTVLGEHVAMQPFAAWQQAFDPLLTAGARNYWKSHNFSALDDGLLDVVIGAARTAPSPQCEVFIASLGGGASRPSVDSAAYAHRDAEFVMNAHGRWDDAKDDERGIRWTRDLFAASAPFSTGGVYVNFLTGDEQDRVRAAYGANYHRLARVKRTYDPENVFRMNQNIAPA
jgi:FAD/FMN-containing dehydrogenase